MERKKRKRGKIGKQEGIKSMYFPGRKVVTNFRFAVGFHVLPRKAFINKLGNVRIAELLWRFRLVLVE
jgi:hypothetical protein